MAAEYDCLELGRFSVGYRALFGEAPSVTLQRLAVARALLRASSAYDRPHRYSAASIARRRAAREVIRTIRELLRSTTATEDEVLESMAGL